MQQSWTFSSPPSGATSVMTLSDVSRQLPASAKGPMRRSSTAQGDALVQLRMRCSVFRGRPSPLTQLSHFPSFTVRVLLRLVPRLRTQRRATRTPQRVGTCSSSSCTVTLPSWWRCCFQDVTTDSELDLMSALGQQPVSSFLLC